MIELRIHGRGGQGGVTLAKLLAATEYREGRSVQAFGVYAAERSGAPLQAFLRLDDQPIHNPNLIYEPDHLIVLDPTLIDTGIVEGLKPGGCMLLNTDMTPGQFDRFGTYSAFRVATVDAAAIARRHGLGTRSLPIVNTALAGAATRVFGWSLNALLDAFGEWGLGDNNHEAAREAHEQVVWQRAKVTRGRARRRAPTHQRIPGLVNGNTGAPPAIRTGQWAGRQPVRRDATPPCNSVCPAGNDVQGFLAALAEDEVDQALRILLRTSPLPSVCGRVCPGFCMQECNRRVLDGAVNVPALERYAGDHGAVTLAPGPERPQRVAVIGSGPAGLAGAYQLARLGYGVVLFEAAGELGGLMRSAIPAYRLPRDVLDRDLQRILALGIEVRRNTPVDRSGLEALQAAFDAVLVATGLQQLTSLDLGLDMSGVEQGIEFLRRAATGKHNIEGQKVVVIGGGNTAIDAARSAWRSGASEVRVLYRRTRSDMPAISEEVSAALDEGIQIDFLTAPEQLLQRDNERLLRCVRMEPGEPDESGRRRPVVLAGSGFELRCDHVILALGQKRDLSLLPDEFQLPASGEHKEVPPGVFLAAGDLLTNEGTVTAAIGCGRDMALNLHAHFSGERLGASRAEAADVVRSDRIRLQDFQRSEPRSGQVLPLSGRRRNFLEVHQGLENLDEARRCMSCGVCNACDRCVTWCPDGVARREGRNIIFDYDYCKGCGVCATECSRAAIVMKAG